MKGFLGFLAGVLAGILLLAAFGFAATVFNAGGGQISGVADPSEESDAATKAYVDARLPAPTCVPKHVTDSYAGTSTTGSICSSCKGWLLGINLWDTETDGGWMMLQMDSSTQNYSFSGSTSDSWFHMSRFESQLNYTLADIGSGTTYMKVTYCEE